MLAMGDQSLVEAVELGVTVRNGRIISHKSLGGSMLRRIKAAVQMPLQQLFAAIHGVVASLGEGQALSDSLLTGLRTWHSW